MSMCANRVSLALGSYKVLQNISLEVVPGSITAVIGPNGAGKSSLLRVLNGELAPSSGEVFLDGVALKVLSTAELARRRSVITQSGLMAFDFLVEEVLSMGWIHGGGREAFTGPLHEAAAQCGISHLVGRRFRSLSGGERQRVHFARALLQVWRIEEPRDSQKYSASHQPRYMLLDEPTSSMDIAHELSILRVIRRITEQKLGILMVLHNLNLAARFADHVVLLSQGDMVAAGTPERVFKNDILSRIYQTPVLVEQHAQLGHLVVHTH